MTVLVPVRELNANQVMGAQTSFIDIEWAGRTVRIEHQWIALERTGPLMIFLHEGLGSVSAWRDFPKTLCERLGCRGLVYSRPGYGRSTARAPAERWGLDFMHRQAHEVLPSLLLGLGVDSSRERPWLFGHSDGASMALLYTAKFPQNVGGLILLAPHIMVEPISIRGIEAARQAYVKGQLRQALARHHEDPDSAFWGWNDAWLSPAFRAWSIEEEIASIRCPVLAVQGLQDEYGTLEQIRGIARRLPQTELLELADCRHAPQRDQPEALIHRVRNFIAGRSMPAR